MSSTVKTLKKLKEKRKEREKEKKSKFLDFHVAFHEAELLKKKKSVPRARKHVISRS